MAAIRRVGLVNLCFFVPLCLSVSVLKDPREYKAVADERATNRMDDRFQNKDMRNLDIRYQQAQQDFVRDSDRNVNVGGIPQNMNIKNPAQDRGMQPPPPQPQPLNPNVPDNYERDNPPPPRPKPIRISEHPDCAEDVKALCSSTTVNNNFAVLDCLQNDVKVQMLKPVLQQL